MSTKFTILYKKVKNIAISITEARLLIWVVGLLLLMITNGSVLYWQILFLSAWNASWVLSNVRRMRMGGNARLAWSRQRKSWRSEPASFFKIGAEERQRMCHNNSIHRQNIWCFFEIIKIMLILSLLRKHDNVSMLRDRQASARRMCATKRYSIWIDPIKKCTSNEMWRIIADSAYGCIRRGCCFVAEFSAAKRELVRATPLQHGSIWARFKGSVVKMTDENHILSMMRSMNIIQIGKSSIALW